MSDFRIAKIGVIYKPTGEHVPPDMSNPRWREYMAAFDAGDYPDQEEVPSPPAPDYRLHYREQGSARKQRKIADLTDDEFIALMREGGVK